MSKLDDIIQNHSFQTIALADGDPTELVDSATKLAIKDLIQTLVDETFDKDDPKAYEFWQKVQAL